jgi:hypothetical protein
MKPNDISLTAIYDDRIEDNIKEWKEAVDSSQCYIAMICSAVLSFSFSLFDNIVTFS